MYKKLNGCEQKKVCSCQLQYLTVVIQLLTISGIHLEKPAALKMQRDGQNY